jgi:hypothetical protein
MVNIEALKEAFHFRGKRLSGRNQKKSRESTSIF